MNIIAIAVSALIPMVMGFIWYNPKVLGTAWMKAAGMNEDSMKNANMGVIFGVSLLLAFMLAFFMQVMVIHQFHMGSILKFQADSMDPNSESSLMLARFTELYGMSHRTFKHGALHGFIGGLFLAMPILATNALFERKGFKYIAINAGYWIITMCLMGGVISAWV